MEEASHLCDQVRTEEASHLYDQVRTEEASHLCDQGRMEEASHLYDQGRMEEASHLNGGGIYRPSHLSGGGIYQTFQPLGGNGQVSLGCRSLNVSTELQRPLSVIGGDRAVGVDDGQMSRTVKCVAKVL